MKNLIFLLLILCITFNIAPPSMSRFIGKDCICQWVRQNDMTFKGCVNDIVHFNMQKVIAVGDSGQVLLSTDYCASMKNVNPGLNSCFKSVSFLNEQTGFACGSNGKIIKTTNGGFNWISLNTLGATETFFGIQAFNGSLVIAVGENGIVLKSTNNGVNWSVKNSDVSCYLLSVKFFNQNIGVAVGWPGRILRTTNGGESWYRIYHNLFYTAQIFSIDSRNNTVFIAGDSTLIAKSTDFGINWIRIDTSISPSGTPFYKIKVIDSLKVMALGDNYRLSTDGGESFSYYGAWHYYGSSIFATKSIALKTIDTGYVCGNKGIGTPFYYLSSLYLIDLPYSVYDLHELSITDANNCWVLGRGFFAHNLPHIVYKTTNGGLNWNFQSIYNTVANVFLSVLFFNTNTGYISGNDGPYGFLLKTTDNGLNWIQSSYGNAGQFASALKNFGNRLYTTNNLGYVIYTTNDGADWTNVSTPPSTAFSNYAIADTNIYYGYNSNSSGNLFKSTNSGVNWIFLTNPLTGINWRDITFINKNIGYLVGDKSAVIKTTDGNNFNVIQSGISSNNLIFNSVFAVDSLFVYIAGDSGAVFKSTNGGANWLQLNSGVKDKLTKIKFIDRNTGWITGWNGVILHTSNGGLVWVINNNQIVHNFKLFQNYPNPFNPVTKIKFDVPPSLSFPNVSIGNPVILKVYDIAGREIQTLVNESLNPGTYEVTFNIESATEHRRTFGSGVYFYKMTAGNYSETKKMLLIK